MQSSTSIVLRKTIATLWNELRQATESEDAEFEHYQRKLRSKDRTIATQSNELKILREGTAKKLQDQKTNFEREAKEILRLHQDALKSKEADYKKEMRQRDFKIARLMEEKLTLSGELKTTQTNMKTLQEQQNECLLNLAALEAAERENKGMMRIQRDQIVLLKKENSAQKSQIRELSASEKTKKTLAEYAELQSEDIEYLDMVLGDNKGQNFASC